MNYRSRVQLPGFTVNLELFGAAFKNTTPECTPLICGVEKYTGINIAMKPRLLKKKKCIFIPAGIIERCHLLPVNGAHSVTKLA